MEDITLKHVKPAKLIEGFQDEELDAILPWEPFGFQNIALLGDKVTVHDTKNLNTLSFNLISAKADNAIVKKATCIIQGLSKAIDYIVSNPVQSKAIVIDELNLSTEFIEWVWPDYIFKLGLNQSLLLSIKSQTIWAIETQMSYFKEAPHVEHFIDSRALSQVMPNAVNIAQ